MKIISLNTKIVYDYEAKKSGENNTICPECDKDRKHRNKKSFSWNDTKKTGYCHHCQTSFVEFKAKLEKKEYKLPEWKNITNLTDKAVKYFTGRSISQKTLNLMKVYSDMEFMPQLEKESEVICFPYFYEEKLINIKYRGAEKSFKLHKDSELILYNIDCIKKYKTIIIVEGEIDCLSFIEIGMLNCVSVPNGANKNLIYLDNYIDLFDDKDLIIATDNDFKGIELRQELIRRFGAERCKIINFEDCKDANEYLQKYGGLKLADLKLIEIPIDGIISLYSKYNEIYDLYLNGMQQGKTIKMDCIDKLISFETSRLFIFTGIPGHGKSELLDFILIRLNIIHNWKIGYFSPENWPLQYHISKLVSKISGKQFNSIHLDQNELDKTLVYIDENFFFVYPENETTIDIILEKAAFLVKKNGIKIFVIDPYNKIEHLKNSGETETEYISRFLDRVTMFAKKYDVLMIIVAHPRKMNKDASGAYEIPNLYDINGSANFYNKADYGCTVYRHFGSKEDPQNLIEFYIQKIKFKHLGEIGKVDLKYNFINGRFEPYENILELWDNGTWI
jgi:twinkle protein